MNSDNHTNESYKLLDISGTDSGSDIPEFTLPRRKVKVKKKLRLNGGGRPTKRNMTLTPIRGCGALCVLKVLGILVVAIGLGVTIWLAVTLRIKVDELRKQYVQAILESTL